MFVGLLAFVFGPRTSVIRAYLAPGIFPGGLISRVTPSQVVYWVAVELILIPRPLKGRNARAVSPLAELRQPLADGLQIPFP